MEIEIGTSDDSMEALSILVNRPTINKGDLKNISHRDLKRSIEDSISSIKDMTNIIYLKNGMFVSIDKNDTYAKISYDVLKNFEDVQRVDMGFDIVPPDEYNIYCDEYRSYFSYDRYVLSRGEDIGSIIQFLFITQKYETMINILNRYHYWGMEFIYAPVDITFLNGEVLHYEYWEDFKKEFLYNIL